MADVKTLRVFDFDGTLFNSPLKPDWWPHRGWWGRPESLAPPLVPLFPNPGDGWWNLRIYDLVKEKNPLFSPSDVNILMTGRLRDRFTERVTEILRQQNFHLFFEEVVLHPGKGSTQEFKLQHMSDLIDRSIREGSPFKKVRIWDDRAEHLEYFHTELRARYGIITETNYVPEVNRAITWTKDEYDARISAVEEEEAYIALSELNHMIDH